MNNNRVYIFDTTLRDGQQSPGAGMSYEDNLQYAQFANLLNVDILEAGFPAASQLDFKIVHGIAQMMADIQSPMTIAALSQLREEQLEKTMTALQPSLAINRARVHIYVPVDPKLMPASLGALANNKNALVEKLFHLVQWTVRSGFEVEFSPEGYSRMAENFDFTTDLIRAAISAGATIINCPDTIGGAARIEGKNYFVSHMKQHATIMAQEFPEAKIIWSTHCHNDLGLALDNSMNAVFDGPARQIEGCINGVGERAGNVALEQCIMFIEQFGVLQNSTMPFYTDIDLNHIKNISDFIAKKMLIRQPHFPIVGDNAAKHSSGGHTNAILKDPLSYQPFNPKMIGSQISFVFGPLSGSNHAKRMIEKYGYRCDNDEKVAVTQAIKSYYADRRKGITDEELIKGYLKFRSPIKIDNISYSKTQQNQTCLEITGKFFDKNHMKILYQGSNSALAALAKAVNEYMPEITIIDYRSNSCDHQSINAKCHSKITIQTAYQRQFLGEAIDADIEISALLAFIDAVNMAYVDMHHSIKEQQYA